MSASRSLSPLKISPGPTTMFKTPSLVNINMYDDVKDAKIKDLEETVAALKEELANLRKNRQEEREPEHLENHVEFQEQEEISAQE